MLDAMFSSSRACTVGEPRLPSRCFGICVFLQGVLLVGMDAQVTGTLLPARSLGQRWTEAVASVIDKVNTVKCRRNSSSGVRRPRLGDLGSSLWVSVSSEVN